MTRFTILLLIMFSLLAASCSPRKNELDKHNLIPEKDLVEILTDVYLADGLTSFSKIYDWFPTLDSISTYYQIIENHGYSKEKMDRTMKFYFMEKPKKIINIYDQVHEKLSEMESLFEQESFLAEEDGVNLWEGKESYTYPNPEGIDSSIFDITPPSNGVYSLKFKATVTPLDQSYKPGVTIYSSHADSIDTGIRNYIKSFNFIKDGNTQNYSVILYIPLNKKLKFRGTFYSFGNNPATGEPHIRIDNIILKHN